MKIFIIAIAIACLAQLPSSNAKVRVFQKSMPVGTIDDDISYFVDEGRLTYVKCNERKSVDHCKIEQLIIPYENAKYSCEIDLPKNILRTSLVIKTFGKDKLIIAQPVNSEIVVFIVHLTECKLNQGVRLLEVQRPEHLSNIAGQLTGNVIVTYNDGFDIFFKDVDRCGNKECKVTFDAEGKLISGPSGYMNRGNDESSIHSVLPIANHSPNKGHVYLMKTNYMRDLNLFLILPNGTEKVFGHYTNPRDYAWNVNNELIGACISSGVSNVICMQYDRLGNIKREEIYFVETVYFLNPAYIYNLPGGGFLFLVLKNEGGKINTVTKVHVWKTNEAGEKLGEFVFQGLDRTRGWDGLSRSAVVWQDEASKQYCASIHPGYYGASHNNFTVNCFDDSDFV